MLVTKINDDDGRIADDRGVALLERMHQALIRCGFIEDGEPESLTGAGHCAMIVMAGVMLTGSEDGFEEWVALVRRGYQGAVEELEGIEPRETERRSESGGRP